jgi:hypothetical protein
MKSVQQQKVNGGWVETIYVSAVTRKKTQPFNEFGHSRNSCVENAAAAY